MSISLIHLLFWLFWLWCGFWSVSQLCAKGRMEPSIRFFGALTTALLLPPVYLLYCWVDRKFHPAVEAIQAKLKELCGTSSFEIIPNESLTHYMHQLEAEEMYKALFETAGRFHATGIFFECDSSKTLAIRFLTQKKSIDYGKFSGTAAEKITSLLKIIASIQTPGHKPEALLQLRQKKMRKDITLTAIEPGSCLKAMMRIEPKCSVPLSSDDLKMSAKEHYHLNNGLKHTSGLILICGAPGSEKESLLYALIRDLGIKRRKNAVLIAPSENSEHPAISVLSVKRAAGISADMLVPRAIDQRREVIFLEEFPSAEPIQQAVHAALTGHLVIAAVPGNNAGEAVINLLDSGVPPQELKESLLMTVSTGVVRKLCSCKQQGQPNAAQHEQFRKYGIHAGSFFIPRGCDDCNSSGYYDEIRINCVEPKNELLTEALEREEYTRGNVRSYFSRMDMNGLEKEACRLAAAGITSPDEAAKFNSQIR